ncbi:MAG: helix-turn-helix domain-containing protein [Pseudomonadota bacterium]
MDDRSASGHMMLISPERVFYAGLLGRPRNRSTGSLLIYVGLEGRLTLTCGGRSEAGLPLALIPPFVEHTITSDARSALCFTVEPESVTPAGLDLLMRRAAEQGPALAERMCMAYDRLRMDSRGDGFTTEELDTIVLGAPMARRRLDSRIAEATVRLNDFSGPAATAADCAAAARLSQSRFLHLFKQQTGMSFRAFRAHKRARHLLYFVNEDLNFAHLAQDIGYPDSTHFCHSIRRFYGLKPGAIFSGSRDLRIYRGAAPSDVTVAA